MAPAAQLSMTLRNFTVDDPGDWSHLIDFARAADDAGVDRLVLSDHVAMGENLEAYGDPGNGGVAGGRQPTGPDGIWLDPLITIAHMTALTTRVRFETSILLAALRRPVVLAKMAATIDVLSGGRLDLGVGVGWQREEYEAAGLSFDGRGALLDQAIEVCQALWREPAASYEGAGLSFSAIHQMPKPRQAGGVPIWVSGTVNERSMRRLAAYGSGWIPWGDDGADVAGGIVRMREAVSAHGRDPGDIGVVGVIPQVTTDGGELDLGRTMDVVPAHIEAGVTDHRIYLVAPPGREEITERIGAVVEAFRAVTR